METVISSRKYRKRPVVISAVEWNGGNIDEIMRFMDWRNASHDKYGGLGIHTLEGDHLVDIGDMVIKGYVGEFYPCKPDIFNLTYEAV